MRTGLSVSAESEVIEERERERDKQTDFFQEENRHRKRRFFSPLVIILSQ